MDDSDVFKKIKTYLEKYEEDIDDLKSKMLNINQVLSRLEREISEVVKISKSSKD